MEEHQSEKPVSVGDDAELRDGLYDEAVTVSAVVTKLQYKTYISSLVRLVVGEQLQLRWIKKGESTH